MSNTKIDYIANKLKKYGAEIYNYRGTEFIGIKNPYSDNNIAITFGDTENVMEFTYQSARFASDDLDGLAEHTEKFLTNKLCSAEFFLGGKRIFGGSRTTFGSDFNNLAELLRWYSCGNDKIAENLKGFFKNDGISLKISSWNGKFDRTIEISPNGDLKESK